MDVTMESYYLEKFRKLGLLDKTALRNYRLRKRYRELQENGERTKNIERHLAREFFISPESVHRIMYDRQSK